MEKKKVMIREKIGDVPSFLEDIKDGITRINEPIEDYIRRNHLISVEEAWEKLEKKANNAKYGKR